jgi:DNA-binding CsgD family transcriptional regulator
MGIIRGFGAAGVAPRVMGIGPIPATRKALQRAGLDIKDIDLFELNEAFSVQALAVSRELGIDHALVGGVMARRWGLPQQLAAAIEHHHSDEATGEAAIVRLADMLSHYAQGQAVAPDQLLAVARRIGLGPQDLREVLFELPGPPPDRKRSVTPCPLSTRELEVLKRLAEGKVYKQIALELGLSTSTVRTHLHNVYGKLGAVDRAQAVLIASERGWL